MVHLHRITTKSGDDGSTSLGDGSRVPKTDPRIVAIGSLDELNATIGLALTVANVPAEVADSLHSVQHELFDAGAELCLPAAARPDESRAPRIGVDARQVARLEQQIADLSRQMPPLDSFVLPGGSRLAAHLHVARTVCRRAERDLLTLAEQESVSRELRCYLNRLSDLLFLLARLANDSGAADVLWRPGQ